MLQRNNFAHLSRIKSKSGETFILKYQIYEIKYSNILISSILNIKYIYIYIYIYISFFQIQWEENTFMSEDLLRTLRRKFRTTNQIYLVFGISFKRS